MTAPLHGARATRARGSGATTLSGTAWPAVTLAVASEPPAPFHPLVRWAFWLFVASIPFEYPGRSIPVEVTTLTGCVFLLATLIQPRRCFERIPTALWCFGGFLYLFWVSFALTGGAYVSDALKSFLALVQLLLIFWAATNLLRDDRITTRALLTLGLACALLGLLTVSGFMHLEDDAVRVSGRIALFGQNANRAGLILGSGALALIGLTYGRDHKLLRPRSVVWPLVAVIGLAMLKGGSRGSLLALTVGLWTFALSGRSLVVKLRNSAVALLAVGLLVWGAYQSPLLRARFARAEAGNLAGREQIFPAAGLMFLQRPFAGWGGGENKYELASRLPVQDHDRRDTHNLVLEVLTSTGLLGAIPFLLGTAVCVWGAWRARRGAHGVLPLAMCATVLTGNMSGNYIALKLFWLVLAYATAAGSLVAPRPTPQRLHRTG
ncbi:MAG TPA: O-antigen ligase family protein [Gemmatimonadales bacterium]|nr:O-antigen ligase family protein [Gemmatimonadales bacterium]